MYRNIKIKNFSIIPMNINGIAHIALNVSDLKKSKLFYDKILTNMGLTLYIQVIKVFIMLEEKLVF